MASAFTKIIRGEIPAHKLAEDAAHVAILDANPLVKGHTLVVPKREVDYYFDLEDEELAALNAFAKRVAAAVYREVPCLRIGVAVVGLEVPHVHMHLVPLNRMADIDFGKERVSFTEREFAATAARIRRVFL